MTTMTAGGTGWPHNQLHSQLHDRLRGQLQPQLPPLSRPGIGNIHNGDRRSATPGHPDRGQLVQAGIPRGEAAGPPLRGRPTKALDPSTARAASSGDLQPEGRVHLADNFKVFAPAPATSAGP